MKIKVVFFDIGETLVSQKSWLPGAQEILADLRKRKIRIGLISNTGNLNRDQLESMLPDDFEFDAFDEGLVLLSSEVGIEKPDLSIFLLAIGHAGVSPWESMFVAETIRDTFAAQSAGMRAVRICESKNDYAELSQLLE